MNEVVAVSEPTRIVTALYLNHERKFVGYGKRMANLAGSLTLLRLETTRIRNQSKRSVRV
jgi:hypothetical protein